MLHKSEKFMYENNEIVTKVELQRQNMSHLICVHVDIRGANLYLFSGSYNVINMSLWIFFYRC